MITRPLVGFLMAFALVGCNPSFDQRYSKVQPGFSRDQVTKLLGAPYLKREGSVPDRPYWGPQEGLLSIIGPNALYEEWQYQVQDHNYLIWFSSTDEKPTAQWVVINKGNYPKGAVFESTQ